jgi:ElaB/YqjD/DUF883 family membrane-anchored ribosome-binding protein
METKMIKEQYDQLKEQVIQLENRFETAVRKHPVQSTAIALGAGALIGASTAWMSRKCS